jgi:hypothetical protein
VDARHVLLINDLNIATQRNNTIIIQPYIELLQNSEQHKLKRSSHYMPSRIIGS